MDQLKIYVESLTGSLLQFHVTAYETILSIKEKIQNLQGIPTSHQHIIFQDRELEDEKNLLSYNIQNGCTLRLVTQMRGGPISTRPLTADFTSQQTLLEEMATEYVESLSGENWPATVADGGGSVVSGDVETQTDTRAPSTTSASPTPLPTSQPQAHVTLLVLRDGDQLNFYRVVDRATSCGVASASSIMAPYDNASSCGSAMGDDNSSASDATLHGSNSCAERTRVPPFTPISDAKINEQRDVEERTRRKMAEIRNRLFANSKQIAPPNLVPVPPAVPSKNATVKTSAHHQTPVLLPRPPSVQRSSVFQSNKESTKPYVAPGNQTLRRRRLSTQQSVPSNVSPTTNKNTTTNTITNISDDKDNFISLADYFKQKDAAAAKSGEPLPSPRTTKQLPQGSSSFESASTSTDKNEKGEIIRCAPYLRELFADSKFFSDDDKANSSAKNDIKTDESFITAKTGEPLIKLSSSTSGQPSMKPRFGSILSATQQPPPSSQDGLANAFAALLERQSSQQHPSSSQAIHSGTSRKVSAAVTDHNLLSKSRMPPHSKEVTLDDTANGGENVDVLERALTTLLLKAELEHLGSSRWPVSLVPTTSVPHETFSGQPKVNAAASSSTTSNSLSLNSRLKTNPTYTSVLDKPTMSVSLWPQKWCC